MKRKKLLVLVDWFWPGYKAGGPVKSCINLCAALNKEYDIYLLTTDTDHGETKPYEGITPNQWLYNHALNVHVYYAQKKGLGVRQLANQIASVDADIVYLNHLFSPRFVIYPLWLAFKRKIKSRIVVCPRGALYNSALSVKKYKKIPLLFLYKQLAIHKLVTFHATNKREEAAIQKYFPGSKTVVADNLPSMAQLPFESVEKKAGSLKCIFIARIVPIKNLLFLLQALKETKDAQIELTIAGPIEDETYWAECKKHIAALPPNISADYIGPKANDELVGLIRRHHLFVLPTTGENFGHSIFEAMQAGRPVLISDQTPWLHLQQYSAGWDLPLKFPEKFTAALLQMAASTQEEFDVLAKSAWQFASRFINNPDNLKQYRILFA